MTGRTISHYKILEKLGEGGMGVVWRARDLELNRVVALKALRPDKVADPARRARFIQEAQAASALNHPNIVTIHDILHHEGADYIVMEFIQGKSLDQLLGRRGFRLTDALKQGVAIADALTAAHAAGIVHRDLKPSNVMVADDGRARILDFGLAKLTEIAPVAAGDETRTLRPETENGVAVGTIGYMSPEQAEARPVDARSDIFSFGSLLYEMVTGRRAFQKDSKMATQAAIIREEPPPPSQVAAGVPPELERIILRCLRKQPERRFQHIDDVKIAIEELKEESDSGRLAGAAPAAGAQKKRPWPWLAGGVAVAFLAAGAAWLWLKPGGPSPAQADPTLVPLTSYPGLEGSPSFSPDGSQVAFQWNGEKADNDDIYVKIIGEDKPLRLTQDPAPDRWPKWSPDGRWIAYVRILPARRAGLYLTSPIGGSEKKVAEISGPTGYLPGPYHAWTPDSKHLAFIGRDAETGPYGLFLVSLDSGEKRRLTRPQEPLHGDTTPEFSPDGRFLAFGRVAIGEVGKLLVLDLETGYSARGEPRTLVEDPGMHHSPTWTPAGREIVYCTAAAQGTSSLRRVGAMGGPSVVLSWGSQAAASPAVSRKGDRMAFASLKSDVNIWRAELSADGKGKGSPEKFVSSTYRENEPEFSPDGARLAFLSDRSGSTEIWVCRGDGSNPVQLTSMGGAITGNPRWSPDGKWIAFNSAAGGNRDAYVISSEGGSPRRLTSDPADEAVRGWSSDGQWVYVARNPRGVNPTAWRISVEGARQALVGQDVYAMAESPDGRHVYYLRGSGSLRRAPFKDGEIAAPEQVLPVEVVFKCYQVVSDGIYFIGPRAPDQTHSLGFYAFATGRVTVLLKTSKPVVDGLSVSPDRRYILWSQQDETGSDLMLVETFR